MKIYEPKLGRKSIYGERIFIGYRYIDKMQIQPLFPFGYGLSYTKFEYKNIFIPNKEYTEDSDVIVKVSIKNIGNRIGKEIVQLYVSDKECSVSRPLKELKKFEKIQLKPNEEKEVVFQSKQDISALITLIEDNSQKIIRVQTPVASNFF